MGTSATRQPAKRPSKGPLTRCFTESGRRDSNPRPSPWQREENRPSSPSSPLTWCPVRPFVRLVRPVRPFRIPVYHRRCRRRIMADVATRPGPIRVRNGYRSEAAFCRSDGCARSSVIATRPSVRRSARTTTSEGRSSVANDAGTRKPWTARLPLSGGCDDVTRH